jgi:cell division protease FtsH
MAGEELAFGEPSTGAERDIEQATILARDVVARYGMSEELGPVRHLNKAVDTFLDADVPLEQVDAATHQAIGAAVKMLLQNAKQEAFVLLTRHQTSLDALAGRLEIEETLEGADLEEFLAEVRPETEIFGNLLSARAPAATGIQ